MACIGQTLMQRPQPVHLYFRMVHLPFSMCGPLCAQFSTHLPQPMHLSVSTTGLPELCISSLPAREPQPMPMFLSARRSRRTRVPWHA